MTRANNDFYPTPIELARKAIWTIPVEPFHILDAGAGTGIWGQAARQRYPFTSITGVDIQKLNKPPEYKFWFDETDYLTWQPRSRYNIVVSNPPYYRIGRDTMAYKFLEKSLQISEKYVLFLLRNTFLAGKLRYKSLFSIRPPTDIYFLVERPSFVDNKTERGMEYMLCLWDVTKNMGSIDTKCHWLSWR